MSREASAIETIRLDVAGPATRAEIAGAWVDVPTPTMLWRLIGDRSSAALVHVVDRRTDIDAAAAGRLAGVVRASGMDGVVARVRYADGALSPIRQHAEAALYAITAPDSVLARPALFRRVAAQPAFAAWDAYWASDLHRVAYRRGMLAASDEVVANVALPAPEAGLLPIERAGDRPFDPDAPTVVVYGVFDASSALTFDSFSTAPGVNLRFLRQETGERDAWLYAASALVVVRSIVGILISRELWRLTSAGVPVHWFIDDNFFVLAEEYPAFSLYQAADFAGIHEDLAGMLVSTEPLRGALAATLSFPAERVRVLPPRPSADWPQSESGGERLGLGIVGSDFRGAGLAREVRPALAALGGRCPIFATGGMRPFLDGIEATFVPRQPDFLLFLHVWTKLRLAAVLHPPGETRNLGNKADSVIMLSHLMGAVPILAPEPAFEGWGEDEGVLKAGPGEWSTAIARALDPVEGAALRGRLAAALSGERRLGTEAGILLAALGDPSPVSPASVATRLARRDRLGTPPVWNARRHRAEATAPAAATVRPSTRVALDELPPEIVSGLTRMTGWYDQEDDLPLVTANGSLMSVFPVPGFSRSLPDRGRQAMFETFVDGWRVAEPGGVLEVTASMDDEGATRSARFVPEMRPRDAAPMTVFLHLPKTAGTTLRVALEGADAAQPRRRLLTLYEQEPHFRNHLLEQLSPQSFSQFDFLYGHLNSSIAETIAQVDPSRRVKFVTVFREPRSFLVSYFFYGRKKVPEMLGHDLFSFLASAPGLIDNHFCRVVVGRPVARVDKAYLEEAKEMLWRHFLFVGATEDLAHTLRRVGTLTGYDLSPWIGTRANVTPESAERNEVDLRRLADATEPLVRYDEQLCAYARRLFA